ncbi:MAG TPA: hypothetical protein VMD99_12090 [Terriglobales bacterium]|nr:hypothetical protein [Terriglobales bacterium]
MKTKNDFARAGLAVVLCLTIGLAGCSTAWIGQAEEIVAALIPAAANIVALVAALEGNGVSATDLQTIQNAGTQAGADLQLIQSLIAAYEKADAAAQPGILNQIQAAISTVQGNLENLLPALHIKDAATETKITAVVGILLSEVESLAAIVPLMNTPALSAKSALRTERPNVPHPKAPLSAREFVESYNATMTAKTGNAALDRATAGLRIHEHGKVARWGTGGLLK